MSHYKQYHIYVGLDLHKAHHTAVIINCWNERFGEIQIENKPSAFDNLMKFVKKHMAKGLTPVYGLEDTGGNGRALAVPLSRRSKLLRKSIQHCLTVNE